MFPDELVILSLFLLPPSKGPKGGILEYLSEQGLVCSNVHGNHHRRILLTEVLTPWFCNLRFFTSSVLLFGADVSGVWKEDLWHHLTLRRGNNHRHGFFNPPLKWIPGYWKPWSHSFKLPITEGKPTPTGSAENSELFLLWEGGAWWLLLVHRREMVRTVKVRLTSIMGRKSRS